jgi:hypothetical protein
MGCRAAVSFLTTRAELDTARIGVLGLGASGGYALTATVSDQGSGLGRQ